MADETDPKLLGGPGAQRLMEMLSSRVGGRPVWVRFHRGVWFVFLDCSGAMTAVIGAGGDTLEEALTGAINGMSRKRPLL